MFEGRVYARRNLSSPARSLCAGVAVGGALLVTACSPIRVAGQLRNAERAEREARAASADEYAPYEFVQAGLYLDKAREESSEAHYAAALELATRAEQSAKLARALTEARAGSEAAR